MILCQACFSTWFYRKHWKTTFRAAKEKCIGIYLSDNDHDCLTNMRFADDVLLVASSKKKSFKKCCVNSRGVLKKWDSGLIQERRKFLATKARAHEKKLKSQNMKVEILTRGESAKYLGQMITFQQQETTEIRNRIKAAWATFHKYRQELTSKTYMLKHRLPQFDAVITPTICYASGTWTPNKEHERMIQSTQRKMLRLIIQTKRRYKKIVKQKRQDQWRKTHQQHE